MNIWYGLLLFIGVPMFIYLCATMLTAGFYQARLNYLKQIRKHYLSKAKIKKHYTKPEGGNNNGKDA